jgi:SAM-dependent methyltransferase
MNDPIDLCLAGRISPEVAIARAILQGLPPACLLRQLAPHTGPIAEMLRRLLVQPHIARLQQTAGAWGIAHAPTTLGDLRAAYDRAAAVSPEAAVAAYSLADPEILAAATAEIIAWLDARRLLDPTHDVLDLGCGIGRIAGVIAHRVRSVTGTDISFTMLSEASRRLGAYANARLIQTAGAQFPIVDQAMDLVIAMDTFPYIFLAGLAEESFAELARILRLGGCVVIVNLSYRGLDADRADIDGWSARHHLRVVQNGASPFRLWDGTAFVLRAPSGRTDDRPAPI